MRLTLPSSRDRLRLRQGAARLRGQFRDLLEQQCFPRQEATGRVVASTRCVPVPPYRGRLEVSVSRSKNPDAGALTHLDPARHVFADQGLLHAHGEFGSASFNRSADIRVLRRLGDGSSVIIAIACSRRSAASLNRAINPSPI